jgi:predicted TIM-barrel fold metal-dependent hydrolase
MIDVNAYLGHFAFRQLRHNTAQRLLALMDRKRIEKAVVSSAAAITYRNAQAGNEEVYAEIKPHSGRLIPFAVLNPAYAGWRDDLAICHERYGMKGLRLYPRWHAYRLTDRSCIELVRAAAERKMAVSVPIRVEDLLGRKDNGLPANYAVDIALMTAELRNEVGAVLDSLGEDRVVFGTGIPFHYADPAIAKLEIIIDVPGHVKEKIRRGNASRILGL